MRTMRTRWASVTNVTSVTNGPSVTRWAGVLACATTPGRKQPPATLLEIAGVRRLPDEPLAAYLLRAHAEAQRRAQPRPRYWWDDPKDHDDE